MKNQQNIIGVSDQTCYIPVKEGDKIVALPEVVSDDSQRRGFLRDFWRLQGSVAAVAVDSLNLLLQLLMVLAQFPNHKVLVLGC